MSPHGEKTRPRAYKRYTTPSFLGLLTTSSLVSSGSNLGSVSPVNSSASTNEYHPAGGVHDTASIYHVNDMSAPPRPPRPVRPDLQEHGSRDLTQQRPGSSRLLRKSSQPQLATASQKRRPTHLPLPSMSFLPLSESRAKSKMAKHASSPPASATRSFSFDRRKQIIPPSPRWSEMIPSIQGVMGRSSSSASTRQVQQDADGPPPAGQNARLGSGGSVHSQVSEIDFGKRTRQSKRDTLELPMMRPDVPNSVTRPIPPRRHTNQPVAYDCHAQLTQADSEDTIVDRGIAPPRAESTHVPVPSPVSIGARSISSHTSGRASEHDLDGEWDMVSFAPPQSLPHPSTSIAQPGATSHTRGHPKTASLSSELDLRAVEVLEHLSSHLQSGWGEGILHQHETALEARSMRSWRENKKAKERGTLRPMSDQGWKRSILPSAPPPPVPSRHSSRLPSIPAEVERLTKKSLSLRRKELNPTGKPSAPLTIDTNLRETTSSARSPVSPVSRLPIILRPLPEIPSASNTPPRGFLQNHLPSRLLRPRRATASLRDAPAAPPRSSSPITAANALSNQPRPKSKSSGPGTKLTRLTPRDEPPAALGKRSTDAGRWQRGMTAMSFLVAEDPSSRTVSTNPSEVSLTSGLNSRTAKSPTSSSMESAIRPPRARSTVVSHIIPPEELHRIVQTDVASSASSITSETSDARSHIARYGGTEFPVQSTVSLHHDLTLLLQQGPPGTKVRQSGPVVPPRRQVTSSRSFSFPTPLDTGTQSNPAGISVAPSGSAGLLSGHAKPSEATMKTSVLHRRKKSLSALTLPTNDRPSTLGAWDSPPGTPSPVERTFGPGWKEARAPISGHEERTPLLGHSPEMSSDDFGAHARCKAFANLADKSRSDRAGAWDTRQERVGNDDADEAVTPKSDGHQLEGQQSWWSVERNLEMSYSRAGSPRQSAKLETVSIEQAELSVPFVPQTGYDECSNVLRPSHREALLSPGSHALIRQRMVDRTQSPLDDSTTHRNGNNGAEDDYGLPASEDSASRVELEFEAGEAKAIREAREARRQWLMAKPKRSMGPEVVA